MYFLIFHMSSIQINYCIHYPSQEHIYHFLFIFWIDLSLWFLLLCLASGLLLPLTLSGEPCQLILSLKATFRDSRDGVGRPSGRLVHAVSPVPSPQHGLLVRQAPEPWVMLAKKEGKAEFSRLQAACQPVEIMSAQEGSRRGTETGLSVQGPFTRHARVWLRPGPHPSAASYPRHKTFLRSTAPSTTAPQKMSWNTVDFLSDDSLSTGGSFLYLEVRKKGSSDRMWGD